ncbi:MAG TPA: DNA topoisomerase IV subunit B [Firmicutes bacterium]|nr:DNA topoisomerase IV subunit B [Bacillota bacterium]
MIKILKDNEYDASSIEYLSGLEGVRKRPAMYIGSSNGNGLHHLVWEIVDNAVDEALNGFGSKITVVIHKDGSLSVLDEGRGIPVDFHKATKMPAVQLIFTTLHSGGKFSEKAYKSSAGLHGVGSAVTNALSLFCDVVVYKNGKIWHIRFKDGGRLETPLECLGPTSKHGTCVTFKPDPKIFSTVDFKWDVIYNHLQESAFLLRKVKFILKDERTNNEAEFYYENGISEYISIINQSKQPLGPIIDFTDNSGDIQIEVAFQYCLNEYSETIYSYVNNVRTRDGGTHETGFRLGITKAVNDFAENNNLLRGKGKLEGSDIREGLTAIVSLRMPENLLEFEGQTKGKLGTQQAVSAVSNLVYTKFTYYLNENKEFAVNLIKKCLDSQTARIAARKAKEEIRNKKQKKEALILSDKLTPAQGKDYALNELFIVEGDSAGGSAKKGRNPKFQAILPLRGKPLNTDSITMDKLLKNEEISTMINTIGAGYGSNFEVENSHYGKVIIMTDADTDGAHIQTLLLTFFYHYMKPLITSGKVYVAVPPLYRVSKETNNGVIYRYAWNDKELKEAEDFIGKGYKVNRYKGLGEMNPDQLRETTMDPKHRLLLQVSIDDPLSVDKKIAILMGKDTSVRKKWVEENVDFNEVDEFIKEVIK